MKKIIWCVILSFVSMSFSANAAIMAESKVSQKSTPERALVKLFAAEAKNPSSEINKYLNALRADPENTESAIANTIIASDIVRLESGVSAGKIEVNYLIIIRAEYQRNTIQVGYLKAIISGSVDGSEDFTVQITGPAKVVIE